MPNFTLNKQIEAWEELREKVNSKNQKTEIRMTFRCPKYLIDLIDKERKKKPGSVSRNQYIIETINKIIK